jgi:hypothetical protein
MNTERDGQRLQQEAGRHTERRSDKGRHRETNRHIYIHRQIDREKERETDINTGGRDKKGERHTGR